MAYNNSSYPALRLNDTFPNLEGETQNETDFDLYSYLGDSWGMIFTHPGDFTPVCTTELGQAALREKEFARRDIKLVGFSCNSAEEHRLWIKDIEAVTGGKVKFPLLCDPTRKIACDLGFLDNSNLCCKGLPLTVRSVYILKPDKSIALSLTYPATTGRSFDELLRVADSVTRTQACAVATPVDWQPGEECIVNLPLSNEQATAKFGKNGYRVIEVPSEAGKDLPKNYLRMVADPGPQLPWSNPRVTGKSKINGSPVVPPATKQSIDRDTMDTTVAEDNTDVTKDSLEKESETKVVTKEGSSKTKKKKKKSKGCLFRFRRGSFKQ